MQDIEELWSNIKSAEREMQEEMERQFRNGSRILVLLNCRQKKPSSGIIKGCYGKRGTVAVELDNQKERSKRKVKNIFFRDVRG